MGLGRLYVLSSFFYWNWCVALPTVILNSPAVSDLSRGGNNPSFGTGRDIAGIVLFAIGLFWEAVSDIQKVSIPHQYEQVNDDADR